MADFVRPEFSEILDTTQADIDARLPGTDSRLRRSVLNVIAYVVAGGLHLVYGFISYLALQLFVDTAETDYLNRHGVIWGVARLQAVQAQGIVDFTGTNGTVIPINTELQRSDSALYHTTAAVTISGGVATVNVIADDPGETGNTAENSLFSFVSPISGVSSTATVGIGGLIGGLDIEDDDSYRERILLKIQQPPQGGSAVDYEIWAKEANGAVTNVWVTPTEDGPGTVNVRFMAYNDVDNGIPDSELIDIVQDYIDSKKPVTAIVTVEAPIAQNQDFTMGLTLLAGYVLADVKVAVTANVQDMLRRDAEPGGTIYKNILIENVLATPGVFNANITVPSGNITTDPDEIVTMGTITWL